MNVRFVTEIDFQSEYNNPSSAQYKNLKRDMKTEVGWNQIAEYIWKGTWKLR